MTSGAASRRFTSTAMDPITVNEMRALTLPELREERWSAVRALNSQGHVKIVTNLGALDVVVYASLVPQASDNFIKLCKTGYYNGLIFHRVIPGFCAQKWSDPTGTGKGGDSIWGDRELYIDLECSACVICTINLHPHCPYRNLFCCATSQPFNNTHLLCTAVTIPHSCAQGSATKLLEI